MFTGGLAIFIMPLDPLINIFYIGPRFIACPTERLSAAPCSGHPVLTSL